MTSKKTVNIFDATRMLSQAIARLIRRSRIGERARITGRFGFECRDKDGNLKWQTQSANTVVTVGKNATLDEALAGSGYTVTGPYMGLISSVDYSAIAAADTMGSHAGWKEAGTTNAPTYTAPRKTCAWDAAAAGAKALSDALAFTFTGSGTVKGAFLVFGSGAVTTIDNTDGTLFSAALLDGGDRAVVSTDVLNVSYTITLT